MKPTICHVTYTDQPRDIYKFVRAAVYTLRELEVSVDSPVWTAIRRYIAAPVYTFSAFAIEVQSL